MNGRDGRYNDVVLSQSDYDDSVELCPVCREYHYSKCNALDRSAAKGEYNKNNYNNDSQRNRQKL